MSRIPNRALTILLIVLLFATPGPAGKAWARIKGDINGDRIINLIDVVTGLRITSALPVEPPNIVADVDGNSVIGIAEALYSLHFLAELRDQPGGCLTTEEALLVDLINDYRAENSLAGVPASRSLSTVARWHVIDLEENTPNIGECNMHSWSDAHPDLWSSVCYTDDHANAAGMWVKPAEISAGVYNSSGYENAAWSSGQISAGAALSLWKNSSGHRAVILEQDIWQGMNWQAMGVGIFSHYAVLWFGRPEDPQGEIGLCE